MFCNTFYTAGRKLIVFLEAAISQLEMHGTALQQDEEGRLRCNSVKAG